MFVIYVVSHEISMDPKHGVIHWLCLVCICMATGYCFEGQQQLEDQHSH